jgi:hypothetical protein
MGRTITVRKCLLRAASSDRPRFQRMNLDAGWDPTKGHNSEGFISIRSLHTTSLRSGTNIGEGCRREIEPARCLY